MSEAKQSLTANTQSIAVVTDSLSFVPIMDREKFAIQVGITLDTLEGLIRKGYVPTITLRGSESNSRRSFVNIVALVEQARGSV